MAGWLDRGFERNTAGLLGSQTDPLRQSGRRR